MQLFGEKRKLEGKRTMALLTAGTKGSLSSVGKLSRTITRHKVDHDKSKEKGNMPAALVRFRETERTERMTRQRFHFIGDRINSRSRIAFHLGGKDSNLMLPYPLTSSCSNSSTALRLLIKSFGGSQTQSSR